MTQPASSQPSRIVIIGASLAGASAAIALRDQGYEGELTLIGEESQLPYERPPLSKALLLGERMNRTGSPTRQPTLTRPLTFGLGRRRPGSTGIARSWSPAAPSIRTTSC